MSSQQTHTFTIENKLRAFNQANPLLLEVKERKTQSIICPMTFSSSTRANAALSSPTDITIEIKDLFVMFRLKEDYYRWLIDFGHLKTIANSILNLPWLALKNVDFDVTQGGLYQAEHSFEELKARLLAKLRHLAPVDWRAQHRAAQDLPFLDIRRRYDFEELIESHQDVMKMYVDLQFTHPISDKSYFVISFPGYLEASLRQDLDAHGHVMYSSLVSKELFARNLWGEGSYTVPDVAFVVHLTIYIPKLKRKKAFTCLIFGQDLQPVSSGEDSNPSSSSAQDRQTGRPMDQPATHSVPDKGQPPAGRATNHRVNMPPASSNEYYVHLNIDYECGVTLFFKNQTSSSGSGSFENSGNGQSRSWQSPPNQSSSRTEGVQSDPSMRPQSPTHQYPDAPADRHSAAMSNGQPAQNRLVSGLSFSQILCELYLSNEEYHHKLSARSDFTAFGMDFFQPPHHQTHQDSFTINNTQNNYYFNGSSGYYPSSSQPVRQHMDDTQFGVSVDPDIQYFDPSVSEGSRPPQQPLRPSRGYPPQQTYPMFGETCSQATYPENTRPDMNYEDSGSQQSGQKIEGSPWRFGSGFNQSSQSEPHHPHKHALPSDGHRFNLPDAKSQNRLASNSASQAFYPSRGSPGAETQFFPKSPHRTTSSSANGGHQQPNSGPDGLAAFNSNLRPQLHKGQFASQHMTPSHSSHLFGVISDGDSQSSQEDPDEEEASSQSGVPSKGREESHTWDEIINDSKILKKYANSKSRNGIFQNLLVSLQEEQTTLLLETMKPIIKDICKNKYGNYVVQLLAKSLHANHLEAFLHTVATHLTQLKPHLATICCHTKGTFAIQGILTSLKDKRHQSLIVGMLKKDANKILKNKDGSYVVKEMYRLFDKTVLEPLTEAYMTEFDKNISDKFAICIFKEITVLASADEAKLKELLKRFSEYFHEMKTSTFYHFGIQYFIEVVRSAYTVFPQARVSEPRPLPDVGQLHQES